ncbi:MAG: radical SAM protein [Desulfobacteraceae bacterium]|nr:MAG: radical SAM protein [Desulfobacteraceae bacterium]
MQYLLSQKDALFPKMVVVSITNACNYNCTHCYYPRYVKQPGYQKHDMEMTVFSKIADELGQHPTSTLRFIAWGEPLLHPNVVEFTRYARKAASHNLLTLITNGYWLTPDLACALMEAGLNLVEVSIDAATLETYRQERTSIHHDAFSRVGQNVKDMVYQRNEKGFRTRIVVSFISYPTRESRAEYTLFEQYWSGIADEIVKRPVHTFKGSVPVIAPLPNPRPPCYCLWARCNINPWGQVNVCYNDWENKNILGDLRDSCTSIANLWQGSTLAQLRADQCRGIFQGICAECRDYNPDAWSHPYEQVVKRCCMEV